MKSNETLRVARVPSGNEPENKEIQFVLREPKVTNTAGSVQTLRLFQMLGFGMVVLFGVLSTPSAEAEEAVKYLNRSNSWCMGQVDDHPCTREHAYRQNDYLAALTDKEIFDYGKRAEQGDTEAMYLLSQIAREIPGTKREYPYRDRWLPRAADAGHPIAKYLMAEEAHKNKELGDEQYLALIEAAALAQGGGDIAWRLAFSYANPTAELDYGIKCSGEIPRAFNFLKGEPNKALFWAQIAADKGNIMAAEHLCNSFYLETGDPHYGIAKRNATETARWCTLAAQAMCSKRGALLLSILYREGIGVRRSAIDALYWQRIYQERDRKTKIR
jgi:TPR repeat protein